MELLEAFLLFIFAVIISSIIYNRFLKFLLLLFKSHWVSAYLCYLFQCTLNLNRKSL